MKSFNHSLIIRKNGVGDFPWSYAYTNHEGSVQSEVGGLSTLYDARKRAKIEAISIYYGASSTGQTSSVKRNFPQKYQDIDHVEYHKDGVPRILIDHDCQWFDLDKDSETLISIMIEDASERVVRQHRNFWLMCAVLAVIGIILREILNAF